MLLCYDVAAIKFAVQTCEPAETVVDAASGPVAALRRITWPR